MMRQYELVERVRRYNPQADEELLNRAYVFAMRAHGQQKRASGRSLFLASARGRRDPHRAQARRRHDRRGDAARHDRGHARHPRGDRQDVRGGDRRSRRWIDQAQQARFRLQARAAGGEFPQIAARDRRRRARAAGQTRRPPAQHANPAIRATEQALADCAGHARYLRAAGRPHGHAEPAQRVGGPLVPLPDAGRPQAHRRPARRAEDEERRADRPYRRRAEGPVRAARHQGRGQGPARNRPIRSGGRWSATRSLSSSFPISTASASSSIRSPIAMPRWASRTRPGPA